MAFFQTPNTIRASGGLGAPVTGIHFLLVAGGGASGRRGQSMLAGGGGGGLRTSWAGGSGGGAASESTLTFNIGSVYTCTVGAGGPGGPNSAPDDCADANGADSSISSDNGVFVTVTSLGGGAALVPGDSNYPPVCTGANDGGTGGHFRGGPPGAGTPGQGYPAASGTGWYTGYASYGGSSASSQATTKNGADGKQVNIDNNNYYWSGGGGGSGHGTQGGGAGNGGSGGGGGGGQHVPYGKGSGGGNAINAGTPGYYSPPVYPATGPWEGTGGANSGGGAGGCNAWGFGGAGGGVPGGSGIVILRMPTAIYTGTVTGAPTVTTVGSDTVITFLGTGTYTA